MAKKYKSSTPQWLVALTMSALACTANAAETAKPWGQINEHFRINGEFQGSYEAWDFFQPSPAINNNPEYDMWVLRARLGLSFNHSWLDAFVQGQYIGMYGLATDTVAIPGGALGLGGAYFFANQTDNAENIFLRQAFVNFKLNNLGLNGAAVKVGRFEFMDGLEYKTDEAKFDNLKKTRVGQRLIGSMAVHGGRTFDGFSLVYDQPDFNLTVAGMRPTQGAFSVQGQDEISNVDMLYSALTSKKGALLPNTEARLFHLYYSDSRNDTSVIDNRPLPLRPLLSQQDIELHTIGSHLLSVMPLGSGSIDAFLWGAYQFGDWTNLSHSAWAVNAELGYQWTSLPLKPWLRAIYYRSSGDDNAGDHQHGTFFTALPSGRTFSKFPFYNLMNVQDTFVQLLLAPTESTKFGIDFHHLQLAESSDLFYGGLGVGARSGAFGYIGRPSGGNTVIGQSLDFSFTHNISKELSWTVYYAHAFGGDVIRSVYAGKSDADTAHVDINLAF